MERKYFFENVRFEHCTALKYVKRGKWLCKCDCGKEFLATGNQLNSGRTKSCGCAKKERFKRMILKHGQGHTRLNNIWHHMKQRCNNPNSFEFYLYGGRGITVCEEWNNDFEAFSNWALGNGYSPELSIDRIDNSKGYSPDNCRWVDNVTQCRNRRSNHLLTFNGQTKTMKEWSEETGVDYPTLQARINELGWSVEHSLTIPTRKDTGENMEDRMLTITDLETKGFNRDLLYRVSHMKDTPFFRTSKRGKFYVLESKFREFISTRRCGK
jgi:hypothetical protein